MKNLIILTLCVFLFSSLGYSKEAYKLLPKSKTCTVSCKEANKKPKVKTKRPRKKTTSSSYRRSLTRQARELRAMKKRQARLEKELKKLREANLILTAKQEEEIPNRNVNLASNAIAVPVSPTIKKDVEISKNLEEKPSNFGVFLLDELTTPFSAGDKGRAVTNFIYNELDYKYRSDIKFRLSNSLSFNWVTPSDKTNEVKFGDPGIWGLFSLVDNPNGFSLSMDIINEIPLSKASRDETKILTSTVRFNIPTKFNDGLGSFRIRPSYTYVFRRYTTPEPTGTINEDQSNVTEINGSRIETLEPYTKDSFYLRFDLGHKLNSKLSFNNEFRWKWSRKYADSYTYSGSRYVLTPEGMTNKFFFKNYLAYSITDTVTLEAGIYNDMLVEDFVPFKDLNLIFSLYYAI